MKKAVAVIAPFAALLLLASVGNAELTQKGNLFIRFDGGISPQALPRHSLAPIGVRIEGTISTPAGQTPPSLRRIRVALNRAGRLSTRGLPICARRRIDDATTSEALAACGPALVGTGGIVARTSFPGQSIYILRGEMLLFNSVIDGHAAILGHIYQADPAPITRVIVFHISRSGGAFGTVISGEVPPGVNRYGYLKTIYLDLARRYVFQGRQRSYISASCAAPPGFDSALFPFARASMAFSDGRTLSSTLVRSCSVAR